MLGMALKKLYRNTLSCRCDICPKLCHSPISFEHIQSFNPNACSFAADNFAVREPYDRIIRCLGFKVYQ